MSSSAAFTPDNHHLPPPFEKICYVQCNSCETDLQVRVPFTSLHGTVMVRCGQCTRLLSVNMLELLPPPADDQIRMKELRWCHSNPNPLINQLSPDQFGPVRADELLKPPVVNKRDAGGKKVAETTREDAMNVGGEEIRKRMVMVIVVMLMAMVIVNALRGFMF